MERTQPRHRVGTDLRQARTGGPCVGFWEFTRFVPKSVLEIHATKPYAPVVYKQGGREMVFIRLFGGLVFASLAAVNSFAQSCDSVLVKDITRKSIDQVSEYAFYQIVDTKEEFDKAKSTSGSASYKLIE